MNQNPARNFSDYIVYVDESGDHAMENVNKDYPIFVLAFCIFKKSDYTNFTVSKMKEFKFNYFGHDIVNLHERDIRKQEGHFSILRIAEIRNTFMQDLSKMIESTAVTVIATVIKKEKLYVKSKNPYHIAMKFCLERLYRFLDEKGQISKQTFIIFEQRGKDEDGKLELEFRRIVDGDNFNGLKYPFKAVFASKQHNSAGLQFADMVARPIGIHTIKPEQENRAYDIIKEKLHKNLYGEPNGCGLKIFPDPPRYLKVIK